jgi:formylglycine-generating enzyme required for sulfatase activity
METTPISTQALPAGTRMEEFVIERVLGSGGFGITYLARDVSLNRQVVIKENLPAQFAWRDPNSGTVRPRHTTGGDGDDFEWSMNNFLKEAETLASLDHPGIVRVLRKFETNGTAYFVMPFVEGVAFDSLIEKRRAKGQEFSEEELKGLLDRMLEALQYLHDRGIYHRDIKPGNILISNDGIPTLIDFGSARQRLSERSMTVIESPGYTPFEQLQTRGNVGPWSDLYALGATLEKAITFEAPPKTMDRMRKDPRVPLAENSAWVRNYTTNFLDGIDKALEVEETERWQDSGQWLAALRGKTAVRSVVPVPESQPVPAEPEQVLLKINTRQAPEGFSLIPAGEFQMGDALDGMKDAPVHTVQVSAFYMGQYEVTKALWDKVRTWALQNGYTRWWHTLPIGEAKAAQHPVYSIDWYATVKWCNARSEMEGLTPCYSAGGKTYRTGMVNAVACNWSANGYRLPTEAEWEKAARGGLCGKRFPWGDMISHDQANFKNVGKETYQTGSTSYHPTYMTVFGSYTLPVGSFAANGYGLHDMVGNVWEWCWDFYGSYPLASQANPRGATSDFFRVFRGGGWIYGADGCRVAVRGSGSPGCGNNIGFRVARSSVP